MGTVLSVLPEIDVVAHVGSRHRLRAVLSRVSAVKSLFGPNELAAELTKWLPLVPCGEIKSEVTRFDVRNWSRRPDFPAPRGRGQGRCGPPAKVWDILEVLIWFFEWEPRSKGGRPRVSPVRDLPRENDEGPTRNSGDSA